MNRTSEEKLIEINKTLYIDNAYLRGELHAARARLVAAGEAPFSGHETPGYTRERTPTEYGFGEYIG